jgi:Holliday junction resolvasome RuvABC ATP-dependent DNA helicase subunit
MISLTRETAISSSSRAYQQLGSRVGSAHGFRPLATKELHLVLQRRWWTLGQTLDPEDFSDAQAIALIMRENFRLIDRLFNQMQSVMKINEVDTINDVVVEAASSTLVIGISKTAKACSI